MIALHDDWVWDSWYAQDGEDLHVFYLKAPKSLGDSDKRHHNAQVGHSVSTDGVNWTELPDALLRREGEYFDSQGIWTGSVLKHNDVWHMFYTGIDKESKGRIQRIGHATSSDLITWERVGDEPILTASGPWYATSETDPKNEEPFRDPWVFFFQDQWHMLVTARDTTGDGTMAHAVSDDLYTWELREPLLSNAQFDQLEVFQVVEVDGRWVLIFCAAPQDIHRPGIEKTYATFAAPAAGPLGPFNLDAATPIPPDGGVYAGRIVTFADGSHNLFGFIDSGAPGEFTGTISSPIPVELHHNGALRPVAQLVG